VPASFCGLYGIRPTTVASTPPACCLRRRLDTTGWFARDAETFAKVSSVMLGEPIPQALPTNLVIATDTFGFADANVAQALRPMVTRLASLIGRSREDIMAPQGLSVWRARNARCSRSSVEHLQGLARRAQSALRLLGRAAVAVRLDDPADRAELGGVDAQEARGRMAHLRGGHDPLPADHAVSRSTGEAAPVRARPARDRITACARRRIGRSSAGQPSRRHG